MNDYEIQKIRDTAFCSGYNTAVSKYENKIAELEKENADLEHKLEQIEKDLADYQFNYPTIKELEAEVKEWKDKADLWCKTANLKDHNIMINKELEKENARLKEINTHTLSQLNLDNAELIVENEKLKKKNAELEMQVKYWKSEYDKLFNGN